ncbi:DUF1763-domain-containing protein [Aspergillus saccharolyticus JOP 1030-1]|uniref:DUF1763-domain-containing protein n=1 Tax=Aspergillus saccharolyticus JOP 1030-1 TaxID=1450539 RepID=A0A318ZMI2_9EURO|nr:DUF1763-domain-containing protein [Aspergillus saccharolyticus JOP 1030-1]PYH47684.1 DUF1763-domain-containing protein [Aspergillus saccharolyticus JOP 1030-1]
MVSPVHPFKSLGDSKCVVDAYRQLYRHGLKAVNYSTPARYVLLHTLRCSFRSSTLGNLDLQRVANTVRFLQRASESAGLEHRIMRNLMFMKYWQHPKVRRDPRPIKGLGVDPHDPKLKEDAWQQFSLTLKLLNESLGTCLE